MTDSEVIRLISENRRALCAFLGGFSDNPADVDDWCQETALRMFAATRSQEIQQPKAYLFRVARNVALSRIAHRQVKANVRHDLQQREKERNVARAADRECQATTDRNRLLQAVAALPERCREVFVMCKFDGYTHREIAEKLGISVSTVEKHLVKGLRLCRQALTSDSSRDEPSQGVAGSSKR
jgi:RNA polymerase sigma-70 factor (ECF subfamily)